MAPKRSAPIAMKKIGRLSLPPAKRSRREEKQKDPRPAKLELVKNALKSQEITIPTPVRELLLGSIDAAVQGEHDERHEFQTSLVKMIESTLLGHRQHLEDDLAAKKKFLEDTNDTRSQLVSQVKETEESIVANKQEVEEKKAVKTRDDAAAKQTNTDLEKAKTAERSLEKKKAGLTGEQTKLIGVYEQSFVVLRDSAPEKKDADKLLGTLMRTLKSMGEVAKSMVNGLPHAIMKAPEARGEFDNMAISAVDQFLTEAKGAMVEKLALHDEEAARASTFTADAQTAADTAQEMLTSAIELLGTAQNELKELEKALKAANSELTKHEKKVTETGDNLKEADEKIEEFAKVEEAFNFLNTYTTKKEVEPEEEEVKQQGEGENVEQQMEQPMEQQIPA